MANGKEFVCTECGATFYRWSGRCPNCERWDTLQERAGRRAPGAPRVAPAEPPARLADIDLSEMQRVSAGMAELDRVLGGGLLLGSSVLLGGAPGIGKSTLLLQAAGKMATRDVSCLYVSCEESLGQVKMRADRIGLEASELAVSAETSLEGALALLETARPRVAVVDSIQRIAAEGIESPPGSLRQVLAGATALTDVCKRQGCALLMVGHVTKKGAIAGPRSLEHLVDTVLYLESEKFQSLRVLRAEKNRFGTINEIGVFQMSPEGLREVTNPSALFLAERNAEASGSIVAATMEGTRALLVEIQALVGPGSYGTPERKVSGVDYRRFSMMLSVLERRAELKLAGCDAFVNVAGGIRVFEPAADLPLVMALASSFLDSPFPEKTVAVGEVGLGGEVRSVGQVEKRLKEAAKLGFVNAIIPPGNAGAAASSFPGRIRPVADIRAAIQLLGR